MVRTASQKELEKYALAGPGCLLEINTTVYPCGLKRISLVAMFTDD